MLTTERPVEAANVWEGNVTTRAFLGDAVDHVVAVGKHEIRARCLPHISHAPGTPVYMQMDPASWRSFPSTDRRACAFRPYCRNRDFDLYWAGVVFSQIGTRGTVAANLYHVYQLTGSVAQTGLVGAATGGGTAGVEPARRCPRRPLGPAQAAAVVAGGRDGGGRRACGADPDRSCRGLAGAWLSVVLTTAAATFDQPARQALIPALVPRHAAAAGVRAAQPVARGRGAAGSGAGRHLHRHRTGRA